MSAPWPREAWLHRMFDSDLKPLAKLVATVYARYAGRGDVAWVEGPTLRKQTSLSRDATNRALRALEAAGWLEVVEPARQHRATRYRLSVPPGVTLDESSVPSGVLLTPPSVPSPVTLDLPAPSQRSARRNAGPVDNPSSVPSRDASVPSQRASVPPDGTDIRREIETEIGGRPSPTCSTHPNGTPDPCRACGDARRAADGWTPAPRLTPADTPVSEVLAGVPELNPERARRHMAELRKSLRGNTA